MPGDSTMSCRSSRRPSRSLYENGDATPKIQESRPRFRTGSQLAVWFFALLLYVVPQARGADSAAKVYVVLWFDTEDYILPASDDAALHVADFLTQEQVRATFKVVG